MTVITPPTFVAGECYEARSFRHMLQAAANGSAGILVGLEVGTITGRNVNINAGSCIVAGATFPEGYYQVVVSTTETVTIAVGDPSNPRIDLIVARVQTTEYGDPTSTATIEVVQGTPGATPVAPTPSFSRYLVLATVNVITGMSSLTADKVVASRVRAGLATVPTAAIMPYAGSAAPSGYLFCDGAAVSRVTYSALFSAIGTTYGSGDGTTTFNLPDLRGRAPIGVGTGTGLTTRTLAQKIGAESVTLTTAELPAHGHLVTGGFVVGGTTAYVAYTGTPGAGKLGIANSAVTANTGSGSSHANMQPSLVLNFIIRSS